MRMLRYISPLLMLSTSIIAAESPKNNEGLKVGAFLRGELLYNNNKTSEAQGTKKGSLTLFGQSAIVAFTAKADINDNLKFDSEAQLSQIGGGMPVFCSGSPIKTAYATWSSGDMFFASMGCKKTKQGGWDFFQFKEAQSYRPNSPNQYGPYAPYNPSMELGTRVFGELTLQVLNDTRPPEANWNTKVQQAWNLEWTANLGGLKPLLQYGWYDDSHSYHFDGGLAADLENLNLAIDYMIISKSNKIPKSTGDDFTSKSDPSGRFSMHVSYRMPDFTPYAYASVFTNKPKATADLGANTGPGKWDHNGSVYSVGATYTGLGDNFSPYLAFDTQVGKFLDPNPDKKMKYDFIARLGCLAHF